MPMLANRGQTVSMQHAFQPSLQGVARTQAHTVELAGANPLIQWLIWKKWCVCVCMCVCVCVCVSVCVRVCVWTVSFYTWPVSAERMQKWCVCLR